MGRKWYKWYKWAPGVLGEGVDLLNVPLAEGYFGVLL